MSRRKFPNLLLGLFLALGTLSGCACLDRPYEPLDCSPAWDPVLGGGHSDCGGCSTGCQGHTPPSYLRHVLTCGSGCGNIYWGEWTSDPPKCDPCDNHGNWIGPQPCGPSFWQRLRAGICGGFVDAPGASCATCANSDWELSTEFLPDGPIPGSPAASVLGPKLERSGGQPADNVDRGEEEEMIEPPLPTADEQAQRFRRGISRRSTPRLLYSTRFTR